MNLCRDIARFFMLSWHWHWLIWGLFLFDVCKTHGRQEFKKKIIRSAKLAVWKKCPVKDLRGFENLGGLMYENL